MRCPYCATVGVGASDDVPSDGTLLLCIYCAGFYVILGGRTVALTQELASDLFTEDEIRDALAKKKHLVDYAVYSGWKTLYTAPMLTVMAEKCATIEE